MALNMRWTSKQSLLDRNSVSLTPMSPVGFCGWYIELHMVWDWNMFMGLNNFSHGMGIDHVQLFVNNQVGDFMGL